MSLDGAIFVFGAFVSFIVAAGIILAFYAPAYREDGRRNSQVGEREAAPPRTGMR
jgi:hypothetical protein